MGDVTSLLNEIRAGQAAPVDALLPRVYEELRRLAAARMAGEIQGHTLQPTALVNEAWIRLFGPHQGAWKNRAHFFGAAAEAMRRILVEHARRRNSRKRGRGAQPVALEEDMIDLEVPTDELLAVHEALDRLAAEDPPAAELVKLRYFVGMTMDEAADALGLGKRTAEGIWTFARVWLRRAIREARTSSPPTSEPA